MAYESQRSIAAVAADLGINHETLRQWVRQDEADSGSRADRLTTAERQELSALRREHRELRRANEILKAASHEVDFALVSRLPAQHAREVVQRAETCRYFSR